MQEDTWLVHGGRDPARQQGMVNPPVYHASTVLFDTVDELEAADSAPFDRISYGRNGTPVHFALEDALARLEGGHGALTTCSGLAAITIALMSFAENGGEFLVADNIYAPTRTLCEGLLSRLGMTTRYYDPGIGAGIAELIDARTKAIILEAPGSLTFEIPDVPAICVVARARNVATVMDNTWATPLFFPALAHGVDVSIHAATKYIVGHADAMLGALVCNERTYHAVRNTRAQMGLCAAPDDVYLGLRGLRTLRLRLARHQTNALALCAWLADRPEVVRLLYPALPDDPSHALWQRDFKGASGLFGVILRPVSREALCAMLNGLELFGMGFSWGGYESLILPVDPARHRSVTAWAAEGPLLRVHAGLEATADLIADLEAGFERLAAPG